MKPAAVLDAETHEPVSQAMSDHISGLRTGTAGGKLEAAVSALRPVHFTLSAVLIIALSYILGHPIITQGVIGSDGALHIAYASWLNEFFPQIPHWYPHQGGGESLLHGYPLLVHYLAVFVHRASGLSILNAFQAIAFLSFPLTAMGLYLLGWSVLGRQSIGLVAAILYLLAPLTWTWIFQWGFLPQVVAMVCVPPGLICSHKYVSSRLEGQTSVSQRMWFVLTVLIILLATLMHPFAGGAIVVSMVFYAAGSVVAAPSGARGKILKSSISAIFVVGLVAGLLLAFFAIPFVRYSGVVSQEGHKPGALHQLVRLSYLDFFGLRPIDPMVAKSRMANPLVTSVFLIVGSLLAIRLSRKVLALGIVALLATIFALVPEVAYTARNVLPLSNVIVDFRPNIVLVMVLYPAIAAFGFWALARALTDTASVFGRMRHRARKHGIAPTLQGQKASVLSVIIAAVGIGAAGSLWAPDYHLGYGPKADGIDLRDIWSVTTDDQGASASLLEQFGDESWPAPEFGGLRDRAIEAQNLALSLPADRPLRIDISPYLGDLAKDFTTYTQTSDINSYTTQISLNVAMWGYLQNVFYSQNPPESELGNPRSLNQVAKWFGTKYVFLHSAKDLIEIYSDAGWELIEETGSRQLWHQPDVPDLATATTRPTVLVIGKPEVDAYIYIFRLANLGMLPYEDALLVKGQPRLDQYDAEALQRFDAVILYGHDYEDSQTAWETIAAYVESGGSLLVETGWQYRIPEWEFEVAPPVLPVERLTWTNYGRAYDYRLESLEIAGEVDASQFQPLVWQGSPWSVSGATRDDVRKWGNVVLSIGGQPLVIAGEYGAGRVVLSGMNLPSHAWSNRNQDEVTLLHRLMSWLLEGKEGRNLPIAVTRSHPDQVEFTIEHPSEDSVWVYWREPLYPNWQAHVVEDDTRRELEIFSGGPGFMLMPVGAVSEDVQIVLTWKVPLVESLATGASILAFVGLGVYLLDGLVFGGSVFGELSRRVRWPKRRERPQGSVEWLKEGIEGADRPGASASVATPPPGIGSTNPIGHHESVERDGPTVTEDLSP